jgi:DNA-binding IclR family transcriptional regulator
MTVQDRPDGITENRITVGNKDLHSGQRHRDRGSCLKRNLHDKNFATLAAAHFDPLSRILAGINTHTFSAMLTTDDHATLNNL